jgi:hypothetical protein
MIRRRASANAAATGASGSLFGMRTSRLGPDGPFAVVTPTSARNGCGRRVENLRNRAAQPDRRV